MIVCWLSSARTAQSTRSGLSHQSKAVSLQRTKSEAAERSCQHNSSKSVTCTCSRNQQKTFEVSELRCEELQPIIPCIDSIEAQISDRSVVAQCAGDQFHAVIIQKVVAQLQSGHTLHTECMCGRWCNIIIQSGKTYHAGIGRAKRTAQFESAAPFHSVSTNVQYLDGSAR